MSARGFGGKHLILWAILAIGTTGSAVASAMPATPQTSTYNEFDSFMHAESRSAGNAPIRRIAAISCVPFVRQDTGMTVTGNAWEWWENAAGLYARGSVPQAGAVLAFETNRHMRLGHVAVVSRVLSRREITIEQSNWPNGRGITRGVPVVDVSERNDWTAVRVGLGKSGKYGSIYPTYGFIYDRKDPGKLIASAWDPAPRPKLNPAPADLRDFDQNEELAEAPALPSSARHRRAVHYMATSGTSASHPATK